VAWSKFSLEDPHIPRAAVDSVVTTATQRAGFTHSKFSACTRKGKSPYWLIPGLTTIDTVLRRELASVITEVMTDTENSSDFSTFLSLVSVGNFSGSSGGVFYDLTIRGLNPVKGKIFFSCARCSGKNEQYCASAFVAYTGYNFT